MQSGGAVCKGVEYTALGEFEVYLGHNKMQHSGTKVSTALQLRREAHWEIMISSHQILWYLKKWGYMETYRDCVKGERNANRNITLENSNI